MARRVEYAIVTVSATGHVATRRGYATRERAEAERRAILADAKAHPNYDYRIVRAKVVSTRI